MATYIKVEYAGDPLLEQSRRNMDSKRNAAAERDAVKAAMAQIANRRATLERLRRLTSRPLSRGRREEPAAYLAQQQPRHQRLWVYCKPDNYIPTGTWETPGNLLITFYSGDASAELTYTSPNYPVNPHTAVSGWFSQTPGACQEATTGCNLVTLPIDRDSCIVCVTYSDRIYTGNFRYFDGPPQNIFISSTSAPNQRQTRGFFIGKSAVKEVTVPTALRTLLEAGAAPTATSAEYPAFTLGTNPPIGAIWATNIGTHNLVWDGGGQGFAINGPLDRFASCAFTDVSAIELEPFKNSIIDPARQAKPVFKAIATFSGPVTSNPAIYSLLQDYAAGEALDYQGAYNSVLYDFVGRRLVPRRPLSPSGVDESFLLKYIGPQPQEGDETYFPPVNGQDDPTYWAKADGYGAAARPLATMPPNVPPPEDVNSDGLSRVFWLDWGISGYNRRALLNLGFNSSDLQP